MRAIVVREFGAEPQLADMPRPEPGPGELLVRIEAAGLNPFDGKVAKGMLAEKMPHDFPMIPGVDGAGTIAAVGPETTRLAVGTRVVGKFFGSPIGHGTFAEYATIREAGVVVEIPPEVDTAVAAALPTAGRTAQCLLEAARVKPGQVMVVRGATGGVGTLLVQLANMAGTRVVATARADAADRMVRLGASETVDYQQTSLHDYLAAHHREDIEVLVDLVGPAEALPELIDLVRPGGRVLSTVGSVDETALQAGGREGGNISSQDTANDLAYLLRLVAAADLVVPIDNTLPLESGLEAVAASAAARGARGKTVLTL